MSTFAIIKPHILENAMEGDILSLIIKNNFIIRKLETKTITMEEAKQLYIEHEDEEFFEPLCYRMIDGPCIIMELKRNYGGKEKCFKVWRELIGSTDPIEAKCDSIRRLFGTSRQYNAVHGSDSEESAARELAIFF